MQVIAKPTDEQLAIRAHVQGNKGNLAIRALAGSGKTSMLLDLLGVIPQSTVLFCAFNKKIAVEAEDRIGLPTFEKPNRKPIIPLKPVAVHVKTFHAAGLAWLKQHYPNVSVDGSATEELMNRVAGNGLSFKMRRASVKLLRLLKETCIDANPPHEKLLALGHEHNIFDEMADQAIDLTIEAVRDAYFTSKDFSNRETIDFCDMVWAPLVLGLPPRTRYQAILADEFQDISEPQLAMLDALLVPKTGRLIAVGDEQQQIYQFRGSLGAVAWRAMAEKYKAKELPLTITWRCAKAVVKEANAIVPALRARADAPEGTIRQSKRDTLADELKALAPGIGKHTFVLSRNNAALLDTALMLFSRRVAFQLNAAAELLDPLIKLLERLDKTSNSKFVASLNSWLSAELAKAEKANATAYADRVEEQHAMLMAATLYMKPIEIEGMLKKLLAPNQSGILLSSVHKVKGLEAERVFLLKQTFARHAPKRPCFTCGGSGQTGGYGYYEKARMPDCGDCNGTGKYGGPPKPEELNIEYVAITRAKQTLVWVDISRDKDLIAVEDMGEPVKRLLGIVSEADQLVAAAARFPSGIHPDKVRAALHVRGEHAADTINLDDDRHEEP